MADREQQLEVIRLADLMVTQHCIPRAKALKAAAEQVGVSMERTPEEIEADEARLEKAVVFDADKQLRALGFFVVNYSQARASKQTAGVQDQEFFHPERGLFFKWEAKAEGGEQSPAQVAYQEMCDACNVPYVCGTDRALYEWLVARGWAVWDECGNLITPTGRHDNGQHQHR